MFSMSGKEGRGDSQQQRPGPRAQLRAFVREPKSGNMKQGQRGSVPSHLSAPVRVRARRGPARIGERSPPAAPLTRVPRAAAEPVA